MIYNENYSNQFFRDTNEPFTLKDFYKLSKEKLAIKEQNINPPKSQDIKIWIVGLGVTFVMTAVACIIVALTRFKTASLGLMIAVAMLMFFLGGTVTVYVKIVNRLMIIPRRMTEPVNALCVGFSLSGNESGEGGIMQTPVFKYKYGEIEYLAYDGIYTNHAEFPGIGEEWTIAVDPNNPSELVWSTKNNIKLFVLATVACAFFVALEIVLMVVFLTNR